ncbi:eIF-2-alpha kinase GCN2-like [Zophobas morio]|uniref:eIF-2-alpha kinase GCN2-like n=1 Tax=Zophobas morio TaxID=2755281 RepID=UPI0030826D19
MLLRTVSTLSNKSTKDEESFQAAKYVSRLLQDFVLGESLGKGGFGEIIKATHKFDKTQVAIKMIRYQSDADSLKKTCREANMLARLSHPNIVRYFNSWAETAKVPLAEYKKFNLDSESEESISAEIEKFDQNGYLSRSDEFDEDDDEEEGNCTDDDCAIVFQEAEEIKELNYLFIQMELCDKRTLRDAIDDNLYQKEAKLTKYFQEICEGLAHTHQNKIIHRDLKPENIFLTCGDVIKIGDFGLSKQISLKNELEIFEADVACASLTAPCGTTIYIAPEFFNRPYCNIKADIYSLGVVYFEMCSQPMTQMEKFKLFPLTSERLNTMPYLSDKKRSLLKSLLHQDSRERPTCDQILEILKSEKSIEDLRAMIRRSQKVPSEQFQIFNTMLKSTKNSRVDLANFFMTTAVKVFELHGGRNIPMPTFLPPLNNFPDNLTTLLNTSGNSISIANTSRLALSYHIAKHKINKIRRYSTEKVFTEGHFWPNEVQECAFQAVTPEPDDHVLDAEMLFIGSEVCEKIFSEDVIHRVRFVLNHHLMFSAILQHCRISDALAGIFVNIVLTASHKTLFLIKMFCRFHCNNDVADFLVKMFSGFNIQDAEREIRSMISANRGNDSFVGVNNKGLKIAFGQIAAVTANAEKFGIRVENIFLNPLLMSEKHSKGLMFKITYGYCLNTVLATGGRFNSVIRRCCGNRGKELFCSACEISFNVDNIVKLLTPDKCARRVDVVIVADEKSVAIPLYKDLLNQNIKCEIVTELILSSHSNQQPLIVVKLNKEYYGIVYRVEKSCTWSEIFRGNVQNIDLNYHLKLRNSTRRNLQLTWR